MSTGVKTPRTFRTKLRHRHERNHDSTRFFNIINEEGKYYGNILYHAINRRVHEHKKNNNKFNKQTKHVIDN